MAEHTVATDLDVMTTMFRGVLTQPRVGRCLKLTGLHHCHTTLRLGLSPTSSDYPQLSGGMSST